MIGKLLTASLREPTLPEHGTRILITRYRPRGVRKDKETWNEWDRRLAPSAGLLMRAKAVLRWSTDDIPEHVLWESYVTCYHDEMKASGEFWAVNGVERPGTAVAQYAARILGGETLTLLCFCKDPDRCHRRLGSALVTARMIGVRANELRELGGFPATAAACRELRELCPPEAP